MSEQEKLRGTKARVFKLNVTTKVTQLCASNPKRTGLLIYNNGSSTVELLTAQNLSYGDGIPIAAGAQFDDDDYTGPYWIVAASGTQDVRVLVTGN
jgi:hypothetical protein